MFFSDTPFFNKLSSWRKFNKVAAEKGEKVLTYFICVKQRAATLESINVNINDQKLAMATLNRLDSSYETSIVATETSRNDKKTYTFDRMNSRFF